MLTLEDAVERILSKTGTIGNEQISIADCHGRVVASDVSSLIDLPGFDNSAMDGYAVVAADLTNVGEDSHVELRCIGEIAAGGVSELKVSSGLCIRIFTGSALPDGADAVVMQEDTEVVGECTDRIRFLDSVKPWENVRFSGEDVKKNSTIISSGSTITSGNIALLAACGVSKLSIGKRPRIGLLATGDELIEPGEILTPGKIYESNRTTLSQLVRRAGGVAVSYPIVPDDLDLTCNALTKAFEECDIVVTSGAVSVGDHDYIKPALEKLGGKLDFWRVSIRPGKPFVFGEVGKKLFFGLPGNPISSFVTFLLLVRPAILKLQGSKHVGLPRLRGKLAEAFSNRGNRRHFARVVVNGVGEVRSAGLQASHALSSLSNADGFLDVPPEANWEQGREVEVFQIDV